MRIKVSSLDCRLAFWMALGYQQRMTQDNIENLARKLANSVPGIVRSVRDDLEQNFQTVLEGGLHKLDLVTREEFEVQRAVLLRTREKLAELEARLSEMETPQDD